MASSITITVKSDKTQSFNQQKLQLSATKDRDMANALARLFRDAASHRHRLTADIQTGSAAPVAASATLTFVSVIATDAFVIGPTTFTATSGGSGAANFDIDGASDTLDAAAAVATINAHPTVSQVVTATNVAGVITITAKQKGVVGNFINLSSGDSTISASAANLGSGTGGSQGAPISISRT